jgi:DNA polymerase-1
MSDNVELLEKDIAVKEKETSKQLIIIDGHGIIFRAYHALSRSNLTALDGMPTGMIFGFCSILFEIIEKYKPHYLIMTFDTSKNFRKEIYPEYKATREKPKDDLLQQMPFAYDIVEAFDIPIFQMEGFEADDLIGTLANKAADQGLDVKIMTGDRDIFQLIRDGITVYLPQKGVGELKENNFDECVEYFGVRPDQVIDFKGIKGDASDNIPGVSGIGDVGAKKLIQEFGSVEKIYENIDKVKPEKIKEKLLADKANAFLSKQLATIKTDIELDFDLEKCVMSRPDETKILEIFRKLGFKKFINELPKVLNNFKAGIDINDSSNDDDELWFNFNEEEHGQEQLNLNVNIVDSIEKLKNLVNDLSTLEYFSIDLETNSIDSLQAQIVGISISHDKDVETKRAANFHIFYIPTMHNLEEDPIKSLDINEVLDLLKPILENKKIGKIGHNLKYEINVFSNYNVHLRGIKDDTIIADYLINSSSTHALKEISKTHLHYFMTPISELIGTGKNAITMDKVLTYDSAQYAGADSAVTLELAFYLKDKMNELDVTKLYNEIELPLIPVLADMEQQGINISGKILKDLSLKIKDMMEKTEKRIYDLAGKEFNINSPKQLSIVLFEDLQIPPKGVKKNKTTGYSTDAGVLEKLAGEYEIVNHIMEYRQLGKIKSTYADSLTNLINPKTGKIHTSYNQTIATTGRLSSTDPNLQNIPIKTELGREIRRAFIASRADDVIITADYSQIELRILTHYTKDPTFTEAFKHDLDIHSRTAMDIFKLNDISEVTPELRRMGKTVNFGIVYGQSAFGLSEKLNISVKEASEIIKKFNETYTSIAEYVIKMSKFGEENGYIKTLFNRRRYIPEINSTNRTLREFGKRTAINTPIQGTAADLIKIAMIRVHDKLEQSGLRTKMLLQVHDELVFESPKEEVEQVKVLITEIMENVFPEIDIPLDVSVHVGNSWVEAK